MDRRRFDGMARALGAHRSRRGAVLGALGLGAAGEDAPCEELRRG